MGQRFLPCQHIRARADFAAFRSCRRRFHARGLTLLIRENPAASQGTLPLPRLAVVTSRKVGNAVRRNTLRRHIREAFRLFPGDSIRALDFLVIFSPDSAALAPGAMGEAFSQLLGRCRVTPTDGARGRVADGIQIFLQDSAARAVSGR